MSAVATAPARTARRFDLSGVKARRQAQFHAVMEQQDLAAVLISSTEFVQFRANIALSSFYWERPFILVLPRDGRPFAVINAVSEHGVRMQVESGQAWIDEVHAYSEIPRIRNRTWPTAQLARMVTDMMVERGLDRGTLGVDVPTHLTSAIASQLPRVSLRNVSAALRQLRWVKHQDEIRIMQVAAEMADWGMAAVRESLKPGRLLQELDHSVAARMMEEAARRLPGENFHVAKVITLSGPAGSSPDGDGAPTGAVVQANVPTPCIVVTRLNGYSIEVHRTYVCGKPDARTAKLLQTSLALNQAALGQAYAGNRLSTIDEAVLEAAVAAGVDTYLTHRAGHGIGTATHEYPEDIPVNPRPIERGEVFSLEPGLYIRGLGGFRIGDAVVADTAPLVLTKAPKTMADLLLG
jgi:Xaa-Pro aminopeptidase/Xaa-Pro dipeptidase